MGEQIDAAKVKANVDEAFEQWRYRADTGEKSDRYKEKLAKAKARVDAFFRQAEAESVLLRFALDALRDLADAQDADDKDAAQAKADRVLMMAKRGW